MNKTLRSRYYESKVEILKYDQNWWKAFSSFTTKKQDKNLFRQLSEKVTGGKLLSLA